MGDFDKALDACNSALPMHQNSGDRPSEASALSALGYTFEQMRDTQKSIQSREAALALYRQVSDAAGELLTLHALGQLALENGDLASARARLERAIEMTESLRVKVGSHQLRSSYMAGLQRVYETYVDLLMQMHNSEPGKGYEQTALQFSERARARSLLDLLAEARLQIRQGADAAAMEKERGLLERLNAKDAAWKRLRNDARTKSQAESIANEINDLMTQLQLVEGQIRSSSPRYAELTQPQLLTHTEIQRQLLDEDTVLLEFGLGRKQSWLWAVTPTATLTRQLPPRREIEAAARRVCELLTARQPKRGESETDWRSRAAAADAELPREARALSSMLLGPISAKLRQEWKDKRLLIVAGGALEYVPFSALPAPTEESIAEPLISSHEVVNLPSASVLSAIRRETVGRKPASGTVAVIADPVFDETDPRVLLAKKKKHDNSDLRIHTRSAGTVEATESDLTRSVRSIDRENLSRLPFSREEAEAIASFVPKGSLLKATDFRANRPTATGGELSNYRIVHLATHGLLNSERPELSGLVLSLVDESGKRQDVFLRMHEIYNLRLPADVVVLSACQTGLGKEIKGEGLVGLTRGFMYAGAQRVVASLWQVDDLATAELMKRFYRGMLKDGMRPAAALRAAQLDLAKEKRWSSPYFWAAFLLQGEWK
jgi:CHAT domain-containing protein